MFEGCARLSCCLLAATALVGCIRREPPAAVPTASEAPPVPAKKKPAGPLEVELDQRDIKLDGQRVGSVDRLGFELVPRIEQGRMGRAPEVDAFFFKLKMHDALPADALQKVFALAVTAGYERVELHTDGGHVDLCDVVCDAGPGRVVPDLATTRTVLVVHAKSLEVWRGSVVAPKQGNTSGKANAPERLLEASLDWDDAALSGPLRKLCEPSTCSLPIGVLAEQSDMRSLKRVLQLAASAWREAGVAGFEPWKGTPNAPGQPLDPAVFKENTDEHGRLPPSVIQKIVRANYGAFRKCYEAGLARNVNLQGKVVVRFVIERDGSVGDVANGGSDLPDQEVQTCIVDAFRGLTFPQPRNGIVTVVYPIMLQPG